MLQGLARLIALSMIASLMLFTLACGPRAATPDDQQPQAQPQQTRSVALYQYRFNPNNLTIPSGTTVTFQNRDPEAHNVNIPALNIDQNIQPNQEWSHTFNTRGEFAVGNRFSDGMRMNITVE